MKAKACFIERLQKLNNEDGASSVLVVFMMIILVTLGAFSLVSSNVNIGMAKKAVSSNKVFYNLDAYGEQFICDVDYALAQAETFATEYIAGEGYLKQQYDGLPDVLQNEIVSGFEKSQDKASYGDFILNRLYFYQANKNLSDLKNEYLGIIVMPFFDDNNNETSVTDIAVDTVLLSSENERTSLNISFTVNPLVYSFSYDLDSPLPKGYSFEKEQKPRLFIERWNERSSPFEYDQQEEELWDGSVVPVN